METVEDLKNDIIKKDEVLKAHQQYLKHEFENGLWDTVDEVLNNPETSNYYEKALVELENENLTQPTKTLEKEKKGFFSKIKKNLKKIVLQ